LARIRTIKPEFPQSESMGRISRDGRLLFLMLFTVVDDEGRTRAAPRMLASLLYPYDDDAKTHIVQWLFELEREGCIVLYSHEGNAYLQIEKWLSHQKIDHPAKSRLPSPIDNPRESSRTLAPDLVPSTKDLVSSTKEEAAPKGAVVSLPDWLDREAWSAFLEMRRRKRAPVTPHAVKILIGKLERWRTSGHDPTAILDASTASAWTNLYEPKAERNGQQRQSPHERAYDVARDYCAEILASGQGAEGGGVDETALALLPAGSNRSPN